MSDTPSTTDKFQSRDELVSFIEEQAADGRREGRRNARRSSGACRGSTAGPVGRDSAGY